MKLNFYFIVLYFLVSCGNRIIYKNDTITVTKKNLYSKWIILDSNYNDIFKTQTWGLVFYTRPGKRKLNLVDTNFLSFKHKNDSMVLLHVKGDSSVSLLTSKYYSFFETGLPDTGVFKFYEDRYIVIRTDSVLHYAHINILHSNLLIIDFFEGKPHKHNGGNKYRLCFQAIIPKK